MIMVPCNPQSIFKVYRVLIVPGNVDACFVAVHVNPQWLFFTRDGLILTMDLSLVSPPHPHPMAIAC